MRLILNIKTGLRINLKTDLPASVYAGLILLTCCPATPMPEPPIVIALGGNAIIRERQFGSIDEQVANTREAMRRLAQAMLPHEFPFVLTHGNGPQVGNVLIRVEATRDAAYDIPLSVAVAQTQGEMGYMIAQVLRNEFTRAGAQHLDVAAVVTQTVVDRQDPALSQPTKPIGPFYRDAEQVAKLRARGVPVVEDAGRGWRRIVPSPAPIAIVEAPIIRGLVERGIIVIAGGGGGVPVVRDANGTYSGIDAIVDKDHVSVVIAGDVRAKRLIILTAVERVALHYRTPQQTWLDHISAAQLRRHHADGQFPPGSMGPKVQAALRFLDNGGEQVVITDLEHVDGAITASAGTIVTP